MATTSPDISSGFVVKSPIRKLVRRLENIFRDVTSTQVVESKNIRKRLKLSAQLDEAAIATEIRESIKKRYAR